MEGNTKKRTHGFSKLWLKDSRYKDWISKVSGNDSLFYCKYCDKQFTCSTSHVARHAQSLSHKNFTDSNDATKKAEIKKFSNKWLENDSFKPWLQKPRDTPYGFACNICNGYFSGGLSQINRHMNTVSHIKKLNLVNDEEQCSEKEPSCPPFEDRVSTAEIRFAALMVENNIPFKQADVILNFFKSFSKDPHVLESMKMGRRKCTNIVSNVLAPTVRQQTVNAIQNTKFSVLIDETSDSTNEKWMTFLVRYVEPQTLDIRTELVDLINLDAADCGADKLFAEFKSVMWKREIPFPNITALSCDNASVMVGRKASFKTKLAKFCNNKLLTLPCPCHSSALIANAASNKLPEYCEEFLRKVPSFINNSPKRAAIFKSIQQGFCISSKNISRFCETRWLTRQTCLTSILDNWNELFDYLQYLIYSEKTKSAVPLLEYMQNPALKGYFLFLKYILNLFNAFNAFFQATETRIHLLQTKSKQLLHDVLKHFLKPALMSYIDSARQIDFSYPSNIRKLNDINFGEECNKYLKELADNNKNDIVKSVQESCLQFYITAAKDILRRLPIDDEFLSKLHVFGPKVALFDQDRRASVSEVLSICQTFGGIEDNALEGEWLKIFHDFSLDKKKMLSACSFDEMWKKILSTEDADGNFQYPTLRRLVAAVRTLPNSNADPERSFSMLPDVKTKKRNRLSAVNVNSICIVKTAMLARKETASSLAVNSSHKTLMASENLYKSNAAPKQIQIQLHAVDSGDE